MLRRVNLQYLVIIWRGDVLVLIQVLLVSEYYSLYKNRTVSLGGFGQ